MTIDEAIHWDVAAYALGVLDEPDAARFEEHLAGCPECAAELESLLPTVELLSEVDIETLHAAERSRMDEQLFQSIIVERQRLRRRQMFTLAASVMVAAMVAGFALVAGATLGDDPGGQVAGPPATQAPSTPAPTTNDAPGIGGPELPQGERYSAADPDTGVQTDVVLSAREWGTQVSFAISSLDGPLVCRLLVVRGDGTAEVASTWQVPDAGYGTEEQPEPLLLQTTTAVDRGDIDRIQVQSVDGDGDIATLVTVPV